LRPILGQRRNAEPCGSENNKRAKQSHRLNLVKEHLKVGWEREGTEIEPRRRPTVMSLFDGC
ncbi:MAG: hypothetical protein WD049_01395, partial [Candidatus Paceibacterota bacterium]